MVAAAAQCADAFGEGIPAGIRELLLLQPVVSLRQRGIDADGLNNVGLLVSGERIPVSLRTEIGAVLDLVVHARLAKHKLRIKYEDIFIIALQFAAARDIKTAGAKRFLPDKLSLVFH